MHNIKENSESKGGGVPDARRGDGESKGGSMHDVRGDGERQGGSVHNVRKGGGESKGDSGEIRRFYSHKKLPGQYRPGIADELARMLYESVPTIHGLSASSVEEEVDNMENRGDSGEKRRFYSNERLPVQYRPDATLLGDENVLLSCDGSCIGNGSPHAQATIGVYCGEGNPNNFGGFVPRRLPQTNQVAELMAFLKAIQIGGNLAQDLRVSGVVVSGVVVASDSEYVCSGVTTWCQKWVENDYKNIHNAAIFREIDRHSLHLWEKLRITVRVWKITRDQNGFADGIARRMHESSDRGDDLRVKKEAEDEDRSCDEVKWARWLGDEWYGDIVYYLLRGKLRPGIRNINTSKHLHQMKLEAAKYVLVDDNDAPFLAYREINGDMARCLLPGQVGRILYRFHDNHGHFSQGIMGRNILGRYYCLGRMKDIARWCSTCEACQRMGPLRSSSQIKPILSLQPMDLMGMDFLGPISPNSKNGGVYIILAVDYFSRYLFAHPTCRNTGAAVVEFVKKIANVFGWPLAFYVDNRSHFVKEDFPRLLELVGTKLFTAPVTNPRLVGLAERYVQLILAGLRAKVEADPRKHDALER